MSDFVIEKNVPMPERRGRKRRWPDLRQMAIGDSFMVADAKAGVIRQSIAPLARYHGIKVSVLSVDGGTRVWRIA